MQWVSGVVVEAFLEYVYPDLVLGPLNLFVDLRKDLLACARELAWATILLLEDYAGIVLQVHLVLSQSLSLHHSFSVTFMMR